MRSVFRGLLQHSCELLCGALTRWSGKVNGNKYLFPKVKSSCPCHNGNHKLCVFNSGFSLLLIRIQI